VTGEKKRVRRTESTSARLEATAAAMEPRTPAAAAAAAEAADWAGVPLEALTVSQRALLEAVRRCIAKTGESPTIRELMAEWGRKSFNGAYHGVRILARKGHLYLDESTARGIRLTAGEPEGGKPPG
jgi:hypothetical protein